jgi:hypothetical protein
MNFWDKVSQVTRLVLTFIYDFIVCYDILTTSEMIIYS